ncbi:DUF4436 family protein [Streptomyces sp. B-S-A8]|uniref:DUF4436 family protein n=1 Tax=Streptomyces solicavernae TaxID=3043614 RepID=A0ABT6RT79_9ACTN|nr:DUF4436 family protein [Streptomyces sp. B-S-A8]MDI3387595.1 DUF4436 family protein [Streptomyces sp. B-S-A8]
MSGSSARRSARGSSSVRASRSARAGDRAARLPWRRLLVGVGLLLTLFGLGIGLYVDERQTRQKVVAAGAREVRDRIEVSAAVQRVDTEMRRATVQLKVVPQGRYADRFGVPVKDVTLHTNAPGQERLTFRRDSVEWLKDVDVALFEGTPSDYPFDRYDTRITLSATSGAEQVPVALRFRDQNAHFSVESGTVDEGGATVAFEGTVTRSRSTFILAWFMIGSMWAVGLAVAVACWLVVGQRRGLQWGALGWAAASLFALVGLRGAAPGSPPNGCLLDYAAFYWAEALIALSLVRLVVHGVRLEHHAGAPVELAPAAPPPPRGGRRSRGRRGRAAGGRVRAQGRARGRERARERVRERVRRRGLPGRG